MADRLIILSPRSRRTWQIPCHRSKLTVFMTALITAVLILIVVGRRLPNPISDSEYARLEAENRTLAVEYKNLGLKVRKMDVDVAKMEEHSGRILAQLEPEKQ